MPRSPGSLSSAAINPAMFWCHSASEPFLRRYLMRNCFIVALLGCRTMQADIKAHAPVLARKTAHLSRRTFSAEFRGMPVRKLCEGRWSHAELFVGTQVDSRLRTADTLGSLLVESVGLLRRHSGRQQRPAPVFPCDAHVTNRFSDRSGNSISNLGHRQGFGAGHVVALAFVAWSITQQEERDLGNVLDVDRREVDVLVWEAQFTIGRDRGRLAKVDLHELGWTQLCPRQP